MIQPERDMHGKGEARTAKQWAGHTASRETSQQSTTAGSSSVGSASEENASGYNGPYVGDSGDLLDQHVAYFLKHNPQIQQTRRVERKRPGKYEINRREVLVEWQYATLPGEQGFLVVVDGPLRQPFSDYMKMTDANAEYDCESLGNPASLQAIPMEMRMTFGEDQVGYGRLDAMKLAKEQANFREQAASYVQQGHSVPDELMKKYEKKIEQKIGSKRRVQSQTQSPLKGGPAGQAGSGGQPASPPAAPAPVHGHPQPVQAGHGHEHHGAATPLPPPPVFNVVGSAKPSPQAPGTPYTPAAWNHFQPQPATPQPYPQIAPQTYQQPAALRGVSQDGGVAPQWQGSPQWQAQTSSTPRRASGPAQFLAPSQSLSRGRTPSVPAGARHRQGTWAPA